MLSPKLSKLIILAMCVAMFFATSLLVPDFWEFDINYQNGRLVDKLPNEIDDEVKAIDFDLPVLVLYSYEKDKLIPDWQWSEDGSVMPLREESTVDLYLYDPNTQSIADTPTQVYYGSMMKLRGRTSSYMQDKKPFSLEFRDDNGNAVDYPFLGLGTESDFVFHAPQIDRSLIRNYIAYTLQQYITDWAPSCQLAELFITTPGKTVTMDDYQGVYLVVEKIKRDKGRIAVGKYKIPADMTDVYHTGGNIIYKLDTYEEGYDTALRLDENQYGNTYSVVYPKAENSDEKTAEAVGDEINIYEKALYEGTDEEFAYYYDIDQIARMMLLTEFVKNYEGFSSSLYYYRPQGGKIKALQWDYDIGTGNVDNRGDDMSIAEGFDVLAKKNTEAFLSHKNFREALVRNWREMRGENGALSEENINKLLENVENSLDGAWQRNHEKYGEDFVKMPYANRKNKLKNSKEEREYIKKFLTVRGKWLDENIGDIENPQTPVGNGLDRSETGRQR